MHGDFSRSPFEELDNIVGPLQQQGRVLLDTDFNAQTTATARWQDAAARAAFGAGVAAVSTDQPDSFRVKTAQADPHEKNALQLTVSPGEVWADGLRVTLSAEAGVTVAVRTASYLGPPFQNNSNSPGEAGTRDAVILDVWREAHHGFQYVDHLIEPALGGPDTTERLRTAMALRLYRMKDGDTCASLAGLLKDDFRRRGRLTASLRPPDHTDKDCPVFAGGGYTGFEHDLYRLEVAQIDPGKPEMFKWSQWNGGLVGRGSLRILGANGATLSIDAGSQPILSAASSSQTNSFYLEIVELDFNQRWNVTYGATVTLDPQIPQLRLPAASDVGVLLGKIPSTTGSVFYRLWNGVRALSEFPPAPAPARPTELRDGICLEFDAPGVDRIYVPGDYWTFPVRAGGLSNDAWLPHGSPPSGVHHHRVPLAVLNWGNSVAGDQEGEIEDCREVFTPRTRLSDCCTLRVGDGVRSHGDFSRIQDAVNALHPQSGGRVCVLPGSYTENVVIEDRYNVVLAGCGAQSTIASPPGGANPVIHVRNSSHIRIEDLTITAAAKAAGVLLEKEPDGGGAGVLSGIALERLQVTASRSGIEVRDGDSITIRGCRVGMFEAVAEYAGITVLGTRVVIEGNEVFVSLVDGSPGSRDGQTPVSTLGGIWLRGGCDDVRVIDNVIRGGSGKGVLLGHAVQVPVPAPSDLGLPWIYERADLCGPCKPGSSALPPQTLRAGPALHHIRIERNRISDMGLDGIGVFGFFATDEQGVIWVDDLSIVGNEIRGCLSRRLAGTPEPMIYRMGYGGIALADAQDLIIRDNVIEDNGVDYLDPVCGIYVFHAEGLEISRNRILNNGKVTNAPPMRASPGARGGIYVQLTSAPLDVDQGHQRLGAPAIKVHDNVVVAPLGRALMGVALGPVSVMGNQLMSRGVEPGGPLGWGLAVLIIDLGVSHELERNPISFIGLAHGRAKPRPSQRASVGEAGASHPVWTVGGTVHFGSNQVSLLAPEHGPPTQLSAISIATLDDVAFQNNQCTCYTRGQHFVTNVKLTGASLRFTGNRLQEDSNTLLSGASFAALNVTTENIATHCLLAVGHVALVHPNNIQMGQPSNLGACESMLAEMSAYFNRG